MVYTEASHSQWLTAKTKMKLNRKTESRKHVMEVQLQPEKWTAFEKKEVHATLKS